eukprot:TRINITY_DN33316_c0_g1_i10.p1 TRINITY_DN33316_c0_g1~~TRINITY_DN33316_c0_g1_i10.p1  ORF type:complete len:218 (+),score=49.37 TRINITY_DN33316_c0_g1_i10:26-679(+)
MPVLDNTRHELFAQGVAKGKSQRDAYRGAGFESESDESVDAAASRLLSDVRVKARVTELLELGAKRAAITVERVAVELAKIGFADIRKAVRWSNQMRAKNMDDVVGDIIARGHGDAPVVDDGEDIQEVLESAVLLVPSDDLDEDTAAAISEVAQTQHGIKIKFHDKKAALTDLGKMLGMFVDKVEHTGKNGGPVEMAHLSREEFKQARREMLADDDC